MNNTHPILYSFRRCPYAMRARLAFKVNNITVELREITLLNKPAAMLAISPKGTVPVLQLVSGEVIDESWDIMCWVFLQNNPAFKVTSDMQNLIAINDGAFKTALDNYKYLKVGDINPVEYYRTQGEEFLKLLNQRLIQHQYLMGNELSVIDWAILPFVRQFANVDKDWFYETEYEPLKKWLAEFIDSELFEAVMQKCHVWERVNRE